MEAPSGEGQDPLGSDVENREPSNVFKCSRCGQNISLVSAHGIERVTQIIQDHLEQCLRSRSTQDSPRLTTKNNIDPLELLMPLQPRRTWSAEDDRRRKLEADPDAYDVGPHSVTCRGCHRPIRLNATGRYYAANWNKHKMGCKIANNMDGGGPSSLESKFTGRVAAFRVSNPSGEVSDASLHSPTSIPAASSSSMSPEQIPRQLSEDSIQRAPSWRGQIPGQSRLAAADNSFSRQVIQRDVDIRSSPAAEFARVQASPSRSATLASHAQQGPTSHGQVSRHPPSAYYAGTPFPMGEYGSDTHRGQVGVLRPQSHTNPPGGVLRAEILPLVSGFEGQAIGRYHQGPDFTNQLIDHGLRQVRNDVSGASLSPHLPHPSGVMAVSSHSTRTPIRGASVNARNSRHPDTIIVDSSSSSASSSPTPAAPSMERNRRQSSISGNAAHHSAVATFSHKVGNRLQNLGALENRTGLGSPHFLASSTPNPTRFALNEPPYPDSRNTSSSALPGTGQTSSSTSIACRGNDTAQMLPSLSSLTQDLPYHAQRLDVVASRDPSRSSSVRTRDHFGPPSANESSSPDQSLVLPPLRYASPSIPPLHKRQHDSECDVEQGSPLPKRAPTPSPFENPQVRQTESRQLYAPQTSSSLTGNIKRPGELTVTPSPRSELLRLGRNIRDVPRPSTPHVSGSSRNNKDLQGARLHPVWKWEKGKAPDPEPERRPRAQGDYDSDNEMNT